MVAEIEKIDRTTNRRSWKTISADAAESSVQELLEHFHVDIYNLKFSPVHTTPQLIHCDLVSDSNFGSEDEMFAEIVNTNRRNGEENW